MEIYFTLSIMMTPPNPRPKKRLNLEAIIDFFKQKINQLKRKLKKKTKIIFNTSSSVTSHQDICVRN